MKKKIKNCRNLLGLGLSGNLTRGEIERAFKKKCKIHPDRTGDDKEFKVLSEAKAILINEIEVLEQERNRKTILSTRTLEFEKWPFFWIIQNNLIILETFFSDLSLIKRWNFLREQIENKKKNIQKFFSEYDVAYVSFGAEITKKKTFY